MIEGAKKMSCGNCGDQRFAIYQLPDTDTSLDGYAGLAVECVKCKAVTILAPSQPKIAVQWHRDGNDGTLCVMPGKH